MENTNLNKEKFFALYWGQKVLNPYSLLTFKNTSVLQNVSAMQLVNIRENDYLQLKSLESISDEDAQKLGCENKKDFDYFFKINGYRGFFPDEADKLRELGYLIGYNSLTPDQIISYGWAKI